MRKIIPIPERRLFTDEFDIMTNIEQSSGQTIQVIQAGITDYNNNNNSSSGSEPESSAPTYNISTMRGVAVYVQADEPTDMQVNDLWIQI